MASRLSRHARPASFDSATTMLLATAAALRGRPYRMLGATGNALLRPLLAGAGRLPAPARRLIYSAGSGREGLRPDVIANASDEDLSRQIVSAYPRRRYPAVAIGSATGSAVHLCAAFGMPLLPQTMLLPMARHGDPDDPLADIEAARGPIASMVERNPALAVHQMFDPSSDRLTLRWFSYLRTKKLRLGPVFERFLLDSLTPGGTIVVLESRHSWPTTRLGPRHVFQFGGVSGMSPEEYRNGSERVERFLRAQGSARTSWTPPEPDGISPEAEWGFDPQLGEDIARFADAYGFRMRSLPFDEADDLSPVVANLYRSWYRELDRPADHLYVESFVLLDPTLCLERSAVPFWLTFNGDPALDLLHRFVDDGPPFDVIDLTMISSGVEAVGLATMDAWEGLLRRARVAGRLAGVDPAAFPLDLAVYARYRDNLARSPVRYALPEPLPLERLDRLPFRRNGATTAATASGERYSPS